MRPKVSVLSHRKTATTSSFTTPQFSVQDSKLFVKAKEYSLISLIPKKVKPLLTFRLSN